VVKELASLQCEGRHHSKITFVLFEPHFQHLLLFFLLTSDCQMSWGHFKAIVFLIVITLIICGVVLFFEKVVVPFYEKLLASLLGFLGLLVLFYMVFFWCNCPRQNHPAEKRQEQEAEKQPGKVEREKPRQAEARENEQKPKGKQREAEEAEETKSQEAKRLRLERILEIQEESLRLKMNFYCPLCQKRTTYNTTQFQNHLLQFHNVEDEYDLMKCYGKFRCVSKCKNRWESALVWCIDNKLPLLPTQVYAQQCLECSRNIFAFDVDELKCSNCHKCVSKCKCPKKRRSEEEEESRPHKMDLCRRCQHLGSHCWKKI